MVPGTDCTKVESFPSNRLDVPKIANLKNHQGADTDASTRGFISKLELGAWVQVYPTQRSRDLDPEVGFSWVFMGWSRGPPEGVEEFLKFCLHSDMGLSRALSSVLILIWGFLGH